MTESKHDPGLGLPSTPVVPNLSTKTDLDRPHMKYTLPLKVFSKVGALAFEKAGFGEEDLTFCMIEIDPQQQDRAAKVANGNPSILGRELQFAALWKVGAWTCRDDRSRLNTWWTAIGTKGRRLVEAAFMEMQTVEETDVESFLSAGEPSV